MPVMPFSGCPISISRMCGSTAHHIIKHRQTVHGKAARPTRTLAILFSGCPNPQKKAA
ncbi:MAG: hypothetical protein ACFNLD_08805 [Kingella oralis]